MPFKINKVENKDYPNKERVRLTATTPLNTKGYAIVDKTFDKEGKTSNEFRHIYIFPELNLVKDEEVILYTGKGTNGKKKFNNSDKKYQALFWGSDHCVWNDIGDTATLISYVVVTSVQVPAIETDI